MLSLKEAITVYFRDEQQVCIYLLKVKRTYKATWQELLADPSLHFFRQPGGEQLYIDRLATFAANKKKQTLKLQSITL